MLLVNPCLGDKLLYGATDQLLESYVAPEEERVQPVQWVPATAEQHGKGVRLLVQHSKVGQSGPGGAVCAPQRALSPRRPPPLSAGREAGDLARQRRLLRQRGV